MEDTNKKLDLIINFIKGKTKTELTLDDTNAIINTLSQLKVKPPEVKKKK